MHSSRLAASSSSALPRSSSCPRCQAAAAQGSGVKPGEGEREGGKEEGAARDHQLPESPAPAASGDARNLPTRALRDVRGWKGPRFGLASTGPGGTGPESGAASGTQAVSGTDAEVYGAGCTAVDATPMPPASGEGGERGAEP
eukprot:3896125-Rhodomonas_salina.1